MQKTGMPGSVIKPGSGLDSRVGIIANKHRDSMKRAEELLYYSEAPDNLCDDLNCGKLPRLLRYIKTGSVD